MLTLTEKIVVHVCYRDIFNAPILKSDLARWVGESEDSHKLLGCIDELVTQKFIESKNGYLTVNGKSYMIDSQNEKRELAQKLIERGEHLLRFLGKFGFVKFIGVSGSVAANNPTIEIQGHNKGTVDLDLYVATSKNTIWIFYLAERIFTNCWRLFYGAHFYCFNYVTDDDFLEVTNKNFYTATELNNLKPILDKGILNDLFVKNAWYDRYYIKKNNHEPSQRSKQQSFRNWIFWLPNLMCFTLFFMGRVLKKFDIKLFRLITFKFNSNLRHNFRRISNPKGGYQDQIKEKFILLMKQNFESYYNEKLMEFLFPSDSDLSEYKNESDVQIKEQFKKYNEESKAKGSI